METRRVIIVLEHRRTQGLFMTRDALQLMGRCVWVDRLMKSRYSAPRAAPSATPCVRPFQDPPRPAACLQAESTVMAT